MAIDPKHFTKYKISDYQVPVNGRICKESFFIISKNREFFVYKEHSLQCNSNEALAKHLSGLCYPEEVTVEKLMLFLPPKMVGY